MLAELASHVPEIGLLSFLAIIACLLIPVAKRRYMFGVAPLSKRR